MKTLQITRAELEGLLKDTPNPDQLIRELESYGAIELEIIELSGNLLRQPGEQ